MCQKPRAVVGALKSTMPARARSPAIRLSPMGSRPYTSMAPIIDRPPARAIACQSSMAVNGDRAGHCARDSRMGTGHASIIARTASRYEAQNMVG